MTYRIYTLHVETNLPDDLVDTLVIEQVSGLGENIENEAVETWAMELHAHDRTLVAYQRESEWL